MKKELIERMKQNRVPNYLLTDEEWECFKSANIFQYIAKGFSDWLDTADCAKRSSGIVHRIHPDYQPEPERKVVKYPVYKNFGSLFWGNAVSLSYAANSTNFIGFEYADGDISDKPRRLYQPEEGHIAEYPKYVLFSEVQE